MLGQSDAVSELSEGSEFLQTTESYSQLKIVVNIVDFPMTNSFLGQK